MRTASYSLFCRASTVGPDFSGATLRVYRGMRWRTLVASDWHVGCKLGEFSKTRQRAVFRAKTLKKKSRPPQTTYLKALRIERLRHLRSGKVRRLRTATIGGVIF